MKVFYRLTEIPSTNPSPVFQEDKLALNKLCLESFVRAYSDLQPHVTFICDYCTPQTKEMIEQVCPFPKKIMMTSMGINETAMLQFSMANELEGDESVLFQETDYLYNGVVGEKMDRAIQELGMVSPYNHPNFYIDKSIHSDIAMIKLIGEDYYRSTERNTLTFGIRGDVFKENVDIFKKYGYLDDGNWAEMRGRGHMLFVALPGFATHMAKDWLSKGTDWEAEWKKYL